VAGRQIKKLMFPDSIKTSKAFFCDMEGNVIQRSKHISLFSLENVVGGFKFNQIRIFFSVLKLLLGI
jgi:hypothetical protein